MLVILRVHILAESPVTLFPLPAWDWILWTSTVCETEIGYRMKAYTILYIFASFFSYFYEYASYFYVHFMANTSKRIHKSIYCSTHTYSLRRGNGLPLPGACRMSPL